MAIVRIPEHGITVNEARAVRDHLAGIGIEYETWRAAFPVDEDASSREVLNTYRDGIERLKRRGGYNTADVIDVHPETAGLPEMLARFLTSAFFG
jgi:1,2-dihydroxy-3-keto-5-methylthiopentene dioxygenase